MDFVMKRFYRFADENNIDPNDRESMGLFINYLNTQEGPTKVPLEEQEAFSIYSQYCAARKGLKSSKEILVLTDRKYQFAYRQKKFKSLLSRKSFLFLKSHRLYLQKDKLSAVAFACYQDYHDGIIETDFIAIEEFPTKMGRCYRVTSRSFEEPVLFTGHFMDRFAERNGLAVNRNPNLKAFLVCLVGMDQLSIGQTKTHHCTLPLTKGIALGHKIKEVFIFKTFVHGDNLGNSQIMEAMILESRGHDSIRQREQLINSLSD